MQEQDKYEYAVIRYVPRVERGEFINVGLAMMCKRRRWMRIRILLKTDCIGVMAPHTDFGALGRQLQSFVDIADGNPDAGPVASFPVEERFRWITAVKSSIIQTSRPHPALTDNLDSTFQRLFSELVE